MSRSERMRDIERSMTVQGLLVLATAGGLLVLIATLYRKGVLKPGDLRETLTADG